MTKQSTTETHASSLDVFDAAEAPITVIDCDNFW